MFPKDFKVIDISLPLNSKTIVYPGNVPVSIETHAEGDGKVSHLSKITMGSHSGTHVDAPKHSIVGAGEVSDFPIDAFVGLCRVLDFSEEIESITLEMLKNKNIIKGERILVKTKNSEIGFEEFRNDYIYLSGDGADYLGALEILLFGIDYISVKQKGSSDNRSHTSLLAKKIPIIEGLNLKDVTEGEYFLSAVPLKFEGVEGAPCRAILLS